MPNNRYTVHLYEKLNQLLADAQQSEVGLQALDVCCLGAQTAEQAAAETLRDWHRNRGDSVLGRTFYAIAFQGEMPREVGTEMIYSVNGHETISECGVQLIFEAQRLKFARFDADSPLSTRAKPEDSDEEAQYEVVYGPGGPLAESLVTLRQTYDDIRAALQTDGVWVYATPTEEPLHTREREDAGAVVLAVRIQARRVNDQFVGYFLEVRGADWRQAADLCVYARWSRNGEEHVQVLYEGLEYIAAYGSRYYD